MAIDDLVSALVPLLSRSLRQHFNIFAVLRHGTHEKQLSNLFAWLLDPRGTHELGDVFQKIFLELVNQQLSGEAVPLTGNFRVFQEVDTTVEEGPQDIADIVLSGEESTVVVENYISSDGHGHDYYRYRNFGAIGGKQSVVVLLCSRHEPSLQADGWQEAAVVTYAQALKPLRGHISENSVWRNKNAAQNFLLQQLFEHFVEGPEVMNPEDQLVFIKAMCDSGESDRYGKRPLDLQAEEFADVIAQHAKRQFEQGRVFLGEVKRALRNQVDGVVKEQVNNVVGQAISAVSARLQGQYEWYVVVYGPEGESLGGFVYGPTAAFYNDINSAPLEAPDYGQVFAIAETGKQADYVLVETGVRLDEVVSGLAQTDTRLCDAFTTALQQVSRPESGALGGEPSYDSPPTTHP